MKLSEIQAQAQPTQKTQKLKLSQITAGAQAPQTGTFAGLPQETVESIKKKIPMVARGQGGVQARRERAAALERIRQENPYEAQLIEETSGPQAALIGIGKGMTDIAQGVGRAIGVTSQEQAKQDAEFERLRSVRPSATAGEIAGQAAPFVVPGLGISNVAGLPARVGLSAALGGTEGATISAGTGGEAGDILQGAAVGAAIGGGAEMALPVLNRAGRYVVKRLTGREIASAVTPDGALTPEVQQVMRENGLDVADLERVAREIPEAAADDVAGNARRQAAFEKLGLTPTEAQRTRNPALFSEQLDMYRAGDPKVTAAIDAQNAQLARQVESATSQARGAASTSDNVFDFVTNRSSAIDDEISSLYKQATKNAPKGEIVEVSNLAKAIQKYSAEDEFSAGVVSAVRGRLQQLGLIDKNGNVAAKMVSDPLTMSKNRVTNKASIVGAEKVRQYMNELYADARGRGRSIIKEMKDALDDDVMSAAGTDYYNAARALKTQYERELSKAKVSKFDKSKTSLVRDILERKVEPDNVLDKTIGARSVYKARDLQALKDYLLNTEGDIQAGSRVWDNLRADALQSIKDKAFVGPANREGVQSMTRAGIDRGFKSIGKDKLDVLFTKQEQQFLSDLAEVASLREAPPGISASPSGPEIRRLRQSMERLFSKAPLVGDLIDEIVKKRQTRAAQQRILKLVDDAARLEEERAKAAFLALRRSRIGETIGAAPVAAVAASQGEDNQ